VAGDSNIWTDDKNVYVAKTKELLTKRVEELQEIYAPFVV
jgi:hypothetical protein